MDIQEIIKGNVKRIIIVTGLLTTPIMSFAYEGKLQQLNDSELSEVNGQALLSLSYIDPNDSANTMKGQGVGFYKLGLEAELELNANIKKLQLGCGGINGANGCDIDIDNLSLSGISDTRAGRVASDAKLTNPFIEFAIKNPEKASTREVVGLRLSAEKVLGLLTAGSENSSTPNGINSLSGYLNIAPTTGSATTTGRNVVYSDTNQSINGTVSALFVISAPFSTSDYNLRLGSTSADIKINGTQVTGTRMSSANLTGTATIGPLDLRGTIVPTIARITVPINLNASGTVSGLTANVPITENLGYFHKIQLNNPLSLSLQSQKVLWPGAAVAANPGWWLAVEDPIDIGKVVPSNTIDITNNVLTQAIPKINNVLANKSIDCNLVITCLVNIDIGNINLAGSAPVNFPIKDIPLATQNFAPNCYGNLKFC